MNWQARVTEIKDLKQARKILAELGCDESGRRIMAEKAVFKTVKLEQIPAKAANLLKQTFLAKGGEVAVNRGTADLSVEFSDVLICATLKQYRQALSQLKMQPWGLPAIAQTVENVLNYNSGFERRIYKWRNCSLTVAPNRTLIMGILNLTPDSFSDGGKFNNPDTALKQVEKMVKDGADIIDVGAESTRPYNGKQEIPAAEEMERLLPILKEILANFSLPVSVDTYKAAVAREALQLGAHIINDVWGLQGDRDMAAVVAEYQGPVVIMHNQRGTNYERDIMSHIIDFLQTSINQGLNQGINRDNFIIDPGIGFGKTAAQNLVVMSRLAELKSLGCPILLGTSRKRFIGDVLNQPVDERVEGTIATVGQGIMNGVNIVRVHDVKAVARAAKMSDAMIGEE